MPLSFRKDIMSTFLIVFFIFFASESYSQHTKKKVKILSVQGEYTGTSSCRPCHEKFYKLWSTSWHGLAMQDMTSAIASQPWMRNAATVNVKEALYAMHSDGNKAWVEEIKGDNSSRFPVTQVMGGKKVYYFLTPFERGRLQVLPVAYDVKREEWFDTAASGVRHFQEGNDEALHWTDRGYAFNTTCYGCHVSQLSHNYNVNTDTYTTNWKEPGINCETCHGPGEKHIEVCEKAPKGTVPDNMMILRGGRDFNTAQNNANCSQCHAKAIPISESFYPGELFSDHFNLVTLEHPDYYPDGRDLGENYTYTSWLMSPCVAAGGLDCLHCHTSSGRFRQKDEPNTACLPCHKKRVDNATIHTMHKNSPESPTCVSCHMPMTEFARISRSDHSMLPPTPETTLKFGSPNACNICHKEKTPQWANDTVKKWRKRDYQKPVLQRAQLIDEARKGNWANLEEIFTLLESGTLDQVNIASFLRLLRFNNDPRRWEIAAKFLNNPSAVVRSAAVAALANPPSNKVLNLVINACEDERRSVRIEAASILTQYPLKTAPQAIKDKIQPAIDEYISSFKRRPDLWTSHYSLGTFYLNQKETLLAIDALNIASSLEPLAPAPLVNAAMAYAQREELDKALEKLKQAEAVAPDNLAVQFNLGLLYAELGKREKSVVHLRKAHEIDPTSAATLYNLGLLVVDTDRKEGLALLKQAVEIDGDNPKYSEAYRFYKRE